MAEVILKGESAATITSLKRASAEEPGIARQVLELAWPAVLEQMLNMTVGIVDTYMVGHLGVAPLAAVGLSNQMVLLASAFFAAVATGSTALVARHIGAEEPGKANCIAQQSLILGGFVGIAMMAFNWFFAYQIMAWLRAEPEVIRLGGEYLRVVSLTMVLMALMFVGNAVLRGAGDTRTPMIIMLAINAINILVAYLFIYGPLGLPHMGVTGSALGGATARGLGGLIALLLLKREHSPLHVKLTGWHLDRMQMKRVLNIGLPAGAEQVLMRLAHLGFAVIIAELGTPAYAAHQVALMVLSLAFMPGFGFGVAATTVTGQYLGAKQPKQAERGGYASFGWAIATMGGMSLFLLLFAWPITALFIDEPTVVGLGAATVRVAALAMLPLAAGFAFSGSLRGAGDTRWVLFIYGVCLWGLRVPLAYFFGLSLGWGLVGAWVGVCIDITVRAVLLWWRFHSGRWKELTI